MARALTLAALLFTAFLIFPWYKIDDEWTAFVTPVPTGLGGMVDSPWLRALRLECRRRVAARRGRSGTSTRRQVPAWRCEGPGTENQEPSMEVRKKPWS